MKNNCHPVRTTIFYGLICSLIFILLGLAFEHTILWSIFFRSAIFICFALYAMILASWSEKKKISVIFPLLFLFLCMIIQSSSSAFLLICLGVLSWIRSGICFESTISKSLGAEIIFSIGGGVLIANFSPYSPLTWGLGIWMFFLIQSLYFVVMTDMTKYAVTGYEDVFEQARLRAERILKS